MRIFLRSIILVTLLGSMIYAFSDQTTTERIIKENKSFIEFINISMSNFAAENSKEIDEFFNVYQIHFNGEISSLQSDYRRAFKDIYKSQKFQVELFAKVLKDYYLDETKLTLDKLAPDIIRSKNQLARLYLTLGYRDRAVSRNTQMISDASNPKLYSYKINQYVEAIKLCRRALRYGLLALFESQDVEEKKYIYNHMFEIEREKGNIFYIRFLKKQDKEVVDEINSDFESYNKNYSKIIEELNSLSGKEIKNGLDSKDKFLSGKEKVETPFEKNVERRVRFRYEKKVATYLRNGEFDKANDIIRLYVKDFNYKLILATLEVLKAKPDKKLNLDFDRLIIHHYDNNQRLFKKSILESFSSKVKVIDDIVPVDKLDIEKTKEKIDDNKKRSEENK